MLINNFGKKYGYNLNIDYKDFTSKMNNINTLYISSLKNNKNISRNTMKLKYDIIADNSREIQNGLEHGYDTHLDFDTSKFKITFNPNLSRPVIKLNYKIIKWFELLIKQLEFYVGIKTGKDKLVYSYKVNAIKKALILIKDIDFKIKEGIQLQKYKGIGKGIINRIDEILKTGGLIEVNKADISGKHLKYVDSLMQIFGIGKIKAYELYTEHGIKSITELKQAIKNKTVKLPENIIKGIKYVDKIKINIPRLEVEKIVLYLINKGIRYDPNINIRICGSFRRESDTSNDIDIIISHPDIITKKQADASDIMINFIKHLIKSKFIIDSLTSLNVATKYMGICRLTPNHKIRRIDIRFMPQESYYTAILYFTGTREFNRKMRGVALSMGYKLNEYGLSDSKGKPFKVSSEKDIFDILNMEYLQPQYRK
jgi:DNA polymerase/3'-5' exonuclease PolX